MYFVNLPVKIFDSVIWISFFFRPEMFMRKLFKQLWLLETLVRYCTSFQPVVFSQQHCSSPVFTSDCSPLKCVWDSDLYCWLTSMSQSSLITYTWIFVECFGWNSQRVVFDLRDWLLIYVVIDCLGFWCLCTVWGKYDQCQDGNNIRDGS